MKSYPVINYVMILISRYKGSLLNKQYFMESKRAFLVAQNWKQTKNAGYMNP